MSEPRIAGRVPPHNDEAEVAVLASIIANNDVLADLPPTLRASDFYRNQHQVVFGVIADMLTNGKQVDALLLVTELTQRGLLSAAGGAAFVAGLPTGEVTPSLASEYAAIVQHEALRRRLLFAHNEAVNLAYDDAIPRAELLARIEALLVEVQDYSEVRLVSERDAVKDWMDYIQAHEDDPPAAIITGLRSVDQQLSINSGDLVVVAADTGGGKSVFLSQIARANGMGPEAKNVLVATLEMTPRELVQRRLMDVANLDKANVRRPAPDARERLWGAAERVYRESKVRFLRSFDLPTILREALRMKRKTGLACLILDYLQILDFPYQWGNTRDQQIGQATRMLKRFALENDVPVVIASQLRRHEGRAATKDDLRESGNIGNDANAIVIIDIPGLLEGTPEHASGDTSTARLLIAKQRMGVANAWIPLVADFTHARFVENRYEKGAVQ